MTVPLKVGTIECIEHEVTCLNERVFIKTMNHLLTNCSQSTLLAMICRLSLLVLFMVRFFHVVEIVGTTCELVGTSRVCFNHVVRSRACACTNVQRDASRHCRHYVIVLFHVVTCSTDAEPVCRAFLSSLLCRLLVITRKSRDCSVT